MGVSPGNCFGHREGDSKQQISSPIRVPILQTTKAKAEARIILLFIQSYCCLSVLLKKKAQHPPSNPALLIQGAAVMFCGILNASLVNSCTFLGKGALSFLTTS